MFMRKMDILVAILLVIGGLNWGLVGFFGFDFVAALFGGMAFIGKIIYGLVGLSALYQVFQWKAIQRRWGCTGLPSMAGSSAH